MEAFALTAPRWVIALLAWVPSTVLFLLLFRIVDGDSWTRAMIFGAIGGVVLAAPVVLGLTLRRRMLRDAAGESTTETWVAAARTASRGPVPADPETRSMALRIANRQLAQFQRFRLIFIICPAFFVAAAIIGFATGSGWGAVWHLVVAAGTGFQYFYTPRLFRKRIRLLSDDTAPGQPDPTPTA
jgi:hypothetical protein